MSSEGNSHRNTEVRPGWREQQRNTTPGGTRVEPGWRERQSRKTIINDPNWRSNQQKNRTQAQPGWRGQQNGSRGTQMQPGWRGGQQQPGNLRGAAEKLMNRQDVLRSANANAFPNMDLFRDAVEQLRELEAYTGEKFRVKRPLSRDGGESAVLLCSDANGHDVVAKVYYAPVNGPGSSIGARLGVLDYMATPAGKEYTLAVQAIGLVNLQGANYYFEIMPYCKDGNLADEWGQPNRKPMSLTELEALTKRLNEALHSIHSAGILHRDIKPENLYRMGGKVVIGDFGVAKLARDGVTLVTVGTPGYQAPETMLESGAADSAHVFDTKCDYYSLGVTLACIYEGRFVYEGLDARARAIMRKNEHMPLLRHDGNLKQIENLFTGLIRYDPNYRFGYDEVKLWLADHSYTGGRQSGEWPQPFRMLGKAYKDEKELFYGICKDSSSWEEAKSNLYKKVFERFFVSFRPDIARAAQDADDDWRQKDRDKGLAVFLKALYAPGPIVWRGRGFKSLQDLAGKMVQARNPGPYADMLRLNVVSHWLQNTEGISPDRQTIQLVRDMEALALTEPELACYWFGNSFAAQRQLTICGRTVRDLKQLMEALFRSPAVFYTGDGYDKLTDKTLGADLYGFLYSFGCKDMVEAGWKNAARCGEFERVCLLLAMLEDVCTKSKVDPKLVRSFYRSYGPVGIGEYVRKLVKATGDPVYTAMSADGKLLLQRIRDFRPAKVGSLSDMTRQYVPLMDDIDRLERMLVNNPVCIQSGVYEETGVICSNLMGCFAFRIFGRNAPLGFSAHIGVI